MSQFWVRLGTVLFIAAGGLQVLAALLFESFRLWPVTSFYPSLSHFEDFASGSIRTFMDLVVRLAAPAHRAGGGDRLKAVVHVIGPHVLRAELGDDAAGEPEILRVAHMSCRPR